MVVEVVEVVVELVEVPVELMVVMEDQGLKEVVGGDLGIDLINQHYKLKVIIIVMGMLILSLQHRLQYQA
jgi:hypothetical protein